MMEENKIEAPAGGEGPKKNWFIIAVVIILILIGGLVVYYVVKEYKSEGGLFGGDQAAQDDNLAANLGPLMDYSDDKDRFTIKMPAGYLLNETMAGYFNIVKDDGESIPEVIIIIDKAGRLEIADSKAVQIVSAQDVKINDLDGRKYIVVYRSRSDVNQCPIYRLTDGTDVYQLSLYECKESDIFETVVNSFKVK